MQFAMTMLQLTKCELIVHGGAMYGGHYLKHGLSLLAITDPPTRVYKGL